MNERPFTVWVYINDAEAEHDLLAGDLAWLPTLGPSATVLTQLLLRYADGTAHDIIDLASATGLTPRKVWMTLDRMAMFKVAAFLSTNAILIRSCLPPPRRQGREFSVSTAQDREVGGSGHGEFLTEAHHE